MDETETAELKKIIHENKFSSLPPEKYNPKFAKLLQFYTNYRDNVISEGTELYKLKQEYDKNPTRKLRRKKSK